MTHLEKPNTRTAFLIESTVQERHLERLGRVVPIQVENRRYWIKQATQQSLKWSHYLQKFLSSVLPIKILRFTADSGGVASLWREVTLMNKVASRGALVPKLAALGENWIALTDLGETLEQQIRDSTTLPQALALATQGANALLTLHQNGGWHGNPQIRNLVGSKENFGFIDFEEDVGAKIGAEASQIRDWLLFLSSLYAPEQRFPGLSAAMIKQLDSKLPTNIHRGLCRIHRLTFPFITLLRPVTKYLGKDVRRTASLADSLRNLKARQC